MSNQSQLGTSRRQFCVTSLLGIDIGIMIKVDASTRDNALVLQVVTPTVYPILFIKLNVQYDPQSG